LRFFQRSALYLRFTIATYLILDLKDCSIAPHFINSFAALPESFYTKQAGDPLPEATLEVVVEEAAVLLGLSKKSNLIQLGQTCSVQAPCLPVQTL
jgi:hypothetical protein